VAVDVGPPFYSAEVVGEETVRRAKARRESGSSKLPLRRIEAVVVVTPRVTETLIKFLKMQLSPNARLNQYTKVWNQIQRQRFKVSSSV
jgi:hypothetical protein